jgi:CcmD family protein
MQTFIVAYTLVGAALAGYVLFLRVQQRGLERRAQAIEESVYAERWADEPLSGGGR